MVTYAQLESEPYWGREIQPAPLVQLGNRLCAAFDRPRNAFGIKGDRFHLNGSHRSQEWILKSRYCTNRTYTVQSELTARQLLLISGFDFNPGSEARMIQICKRLDVAVRAGRVEQVLAWYGNVDGDNIVDGYDNIRNRIATSDSSHLWHLHMTCNRKLVEDEDAIREIGDVLLGGDEDVELSDRVDLWDEAGNKPWRAGKSIGVTKANPSVSVGQLLQWGGEVGHLTHSRVLPALARLEAVQQQILADRTDFTLEQLQEAVRAGVLAAVDPDALAEGLAQRLEGRVEVAVVAAALRDLLDLEGEVLATEVIDDPREIER